MNETILGSSFPALFTSDAFKRLNDFFGDMNTDDYHLFKGHPRGDIYINREGNMVVALTLAGYSKDQLSVLVEADKLVISASKADGDEEGTIARRAFKKVFTDVAHRWDLKTANVSYKDGLLKIVAQPQKRENSTVQLEIK